MIKSDALILGAGAAGLFCALTAARRGFTCTILDRAPVAGQKVRLAGGGKGNVTNLTMGPEWFAGQHPEFTRTALKRCPPSSILELLHNYAIPWEERDFTQIFCTVPAARLVYALSTAIKNAGSRIVLRQNIEHVRHENGLFSITTSETTFCAPRLLIATGSPAWPDAGASDFGMRLSRQWGHKVIPVYPVLVPLICPENWELAGLSGLSLPVRISLQEGQTTKMRSIEAPMLFTHKGISGPAALHASCFWRPGMELHLDFLPTTPALDLMHAPENGKLSVLGLFRKHLPTRLAEGLIPKDMAPRKVAQLSKTARQTLALALHDHCVTPTRSEGMNKAEAAGGGIATENVNPKTMESTLCPGLYFAGEVLDVAGRLGGYNLHWAWASGKAVGESWKK